MTAFACLVHTAVLPVSAESEKADDIVILYTNDVHSGVDQYIGYDGLALYKREMEATHAHVILADAGDAIQGGNVANLSKGKNIVDLMNMVGYDVAALGNHEFDYGIAEQKKRASELNCGYISCNYMYADSHALLYEPYKIIDCGDVQVGFVGAVTPETFASANPKFFQDSNGNYIYSFCEAENALCETIQQNVNAVRAAGADYVVLLAHLGENDVDVQWSAITVAESTVGIDAVIDGHSHETTPALNVKNKNGGDVIITQTGTKLANIGKMTISYDGIRTELISSVPAPDSSFDESTWTEADDRPGRYVDSAVNLKIHEIEATLDEFLSKEVGYADFDLCYQDKQTGNRLVRSQETNLMDFCADAIRETYHTDISFVNGGGIRNGIEKGTITRGDVLNVFPYENAIASAKLTGQQLLDTLECAVRFYPGESGGFLGVSGLEFKIDEGIPSSVKMSEHSEFLGVSGEYRVKDVKINGEPLNLSQTYTVSSIDYLLTDGGDGSPLGKTCEVYAISDEPYADLLQRYISENCGGKIPEIYQNPNGLGRITTINSRNDAPVTPTVQPVSPAAAAPKTGDAAPVGSAALLFVGFALTVMSAKKRTRSEHQ